MLYTIIDRKQKTVLTPSQINDKDLSIDPENGMVQEIVSREWGESVQNEYAEQYFAILTTEYEKIGLEQAILLAENQDKDITCPICKKPAPGQTVKFFNGSFWDCPECGEELIIKADGNHIVCDKE